MGRTKGVIVLMVLLLFCVILGITASMATADDIDKQTALALRANVPLDEWILVSIHQKSLTLYRGVEVVKTYPVATGTSDTPTPIGTFRIVSRFGGDMSGFGTRFLGLNVSWGQFGIHGTNKPQSIGSNASHGCIRMYVAQAEELYDLVDNGTLVVIEGGAYGQLDTYLKTLKPGDRNSHVALVQQKLQILGYYTASVDGIYGQGMQSAVQKVQEAYGLPIKDSVDQAFYQAIGLILFE